MNKIYENLNSFAVRLSLRIMYWLMTRAINITKYQFLREVLRPDGAPRRYRIK